MFVKGIIIGGELIDIVGMATYERRQDKSSGQLIVQHEIVAKLPPYHRNRGRRSHFDLYSRGSLNENSPLNTIELVMTCGETKSVYQEDDDPTPLYELAEIHGQPNESSYYKLKITLTEIL